MVLPIYLYGSEVLREKAVPADLSDKERITKLVADMEETLAKAEGCGLAAPQVGESVRILIVDGTGIHANVHDLLDEIIYQNADIEVNEQGITTLVSKTGINSLGQSETLYSKIQQNADSISLKVSKGSVISEINQTAETVRISASRIDLDGYVTASQLASTNAEISNLTSGVTTASSLKATAINAVSGFTYQNHAVSFKSVTIGGTQYHLMGYQ